MTALPQSVGAAATRSPRRRARRPAGLPWILPALVVSVGILYYCIGYTGYISTLDWDGASPLQEFVGGANYLKMVKDPIFWQSLQHTVIFFVVSFALRVVLGFVFASLLHSRLYLRTFYKVLIFIPVVLATATVAPVFRLIYAPTGTLNQLLEAVGLGSLQQLWLSNGAFALFAVITIQVWQSTGVSFVLYYAAMGQIEPDIVEAARLDGAGDFRVLRSIVWPGVRGTTIALAILTAIDSLKTFDVPFLVTSGGPSFATEFLGTQIYRVSIAYAQVGYGGSLSIVLLVLALAAAILINVTARRRERLDV